MQLLRCSADNYTVSGKKVPLHYEKNYGPYTMIIRVTWYKIRLEIVCYTEPESIGIQYIVSGQKKHTK